MNNKKTKQILAIALSGMLFLAGCGQGNTVDADANSAQIEAQTDMAADADKTADTAEADADTADKEAADTDTSDKVATADEMAEPVDILEPGMVPITADALKDGVYDIKVDSSSSMFQIAACELTVENGQMSAVMTMSGTGYVYLYMGTGEEALAASEDSYIPFVETETGEHTYTVPVEALDAATSCSAFSKKKEKWYDRILVFRADSLSAEAFVEGVITTVSDLNLEDGEYTVNVTLEGGSGKVSVESLAKLSVKEGNAFATIVWNSKNYDHMLVNDEKYDNENAGGNSTFTIPVTGFDYKMPVVGDTTAMSTPHEIEYTLYFEADSIQKAE